MGITKRRDGYYVEFVVKDDGAALRLDPTGRLKRWKAGKDKREAQKQEAIIKTGLLSGQIKSRTAAKKDISFTEFADVYLSLETVQRLRSFATRKICVEHLRSFFRDAPLRTVTADDVRRYREYRTNQGAAIQTVNHDHATLSHMLGVACSEEYGYLDKNVSSLVKKPNPRNTRDKVWTPEMLARLKAAGARHLVQVVTVLAEVGPRTGEVLGLQWEDVNLDRREFTVRGTKNGDTRTVPMTDAVAEVFRELREEGIQKGEVSGNVFRFRGRPVHSLRTAFRNACRAAGIAPGREGMTLHDLRHTAATEMRRAGVPLFEAMAIVGHRSEGMHRRYNTIQPDDLHAAARLLDLRKGSTGITPAGKDDTSDGITSDDMIQNSI